MEKDDKGRLVNICHFFLKLVRGGGITRMKRHLVGVKGDIEPCQKVPADVRFTMQGTLKEIAVQVRGKSTHIGSSVGVLDGEGEVEEINDQSHQTQKGKRKSKLNSHPFFI